MDAVCAESLFGSSSKSDEEWEEEMDDDQESLDSSVQSKAHSVSSSHKSVGTHTSALAERIHRKLCVPESEPLPVKWHRSAVNSMLELRDFLLRQHTDAAPEVRQMLLYAGISIQRRVALGADGDEASDLQVSMALLLMLQVLCDQRVRNPTPSPVQMGASLPMSPSSLMNTDGPHEEGVEKMDAETEPVLRAPMPAKRHDEETLEMWYKTSLKEMMDSVESEADNAWAAVLRITPTAVCRACVCEAPRFGSSNLAKLSVLASTFFRCSGLALQYSMLESQEPRDERAAASDNFLTLGMADFVTEANRDNLREFKLQAIVDSAESEAGQQILRDLILSFTLPASVVGVRRVPLLSRAANQVATEQYTAILGSAHEAAMRGAEWSWKEDDEEIHKIAALLAGLCIQMAGCGGTADAIRKSDAFHGRIQLPFLETDPPPPGTRRLGFVPHRNEWIVYSVDRRGLPSVQLKHHGFEGLCMAALAVMCK